MGCLLTTDNYEMEHPIPSLQMVHKIPSPQMVGLSHLSKCLTVYEHLYITVVIPHRLNVGF